MEEHAPKMEHVIVKKDTLDILVHHVKTNYGFLILVLTFCILHYLLVIGCLASASLSCLNDGRCLPNGLCDCKYGFSGPTCSECK